MLRKIILMIAAAAGLQQTPPQAPLRVNVDLVNVSFTVTDRTGRFVSSLKQDDFTLEEDGKPQEIQRFSHENERPLTIGLLIDKSLSVSRVLPDEKAAATSFLDTTLKTGDLAMVISFDRSVTLEEDFTENKSRLRTAINGLTVGNGTAVYDAIYLACKEQFPKEGGRKAIILITDGQDTISKVQLSGALVAAHQSDAVIYSISNRVGGFFGNRGSGNPETLKRFSLETGGTVFFVGGRSDLTEVFSEISDELRSQYSLGYVSTNTTRDNRYRQIRIVPKDPTYKVKAREGYYAPGS
ncbi:MAG TPA: VWA domain-containing protein [Terriglobia bacterium]|jgi:VWFA-related protein